MKIPSLINNWLRTGEVVGSLGGIHSIFYRAPVVPNTWFLDGQNGADGNDGRDPRKPMKTITAVLAKLQSGDTVYLTGNFTEEAGDTPQAVEDVTFIGLGNRPRHADAARDAHANALGFTNQNSGASWRPPASESGTTPLITVIRQGWTFENILFDAPSDAACVIIERDSGSAEAEHDGSHATFRRCRFDGGHAGIDVVDGGYNVLIEDCVFRGLTDGIRVVSTSIQVPLMWMIRNNLFIANTNHIVGSFTNTVIRDNIFGTFTTIALDLDANGGQGATNVVGPGNVFSGDVDTAEGYDGTADDTWAGNYAMTVTGSAVATGSTNILPTS